MNAPETRYAKSADGVHIAYQTVGDGPIDLILCQEWMAHLEVSWENPALAAWFRRLSSFSRLIRFDRRGTGASDPVTPDETPSLEAWMDDVRIVLDACGSERAAIQGQSNSGTMAMLFAATYPERTSALVLVNAYARLARAPDYPWGFTPGAIETVVRRTEAEWGRTGWMGDAAQPSSAGEPAFRQWMTRMERAIGGPRIGELLQQAAFEQDVRQALPAITAPTLVLHVEGDPYIRVGHGRYLAKNIPGARYVETAGSDHLFWSGISVDRIGAEIREFLTGAPEPVEVDRVLATLLFTDVVDSTRHATELGDRRWAELLDSLDGLVEGEVRRFQGRLIKSTGDGHLATFDGPGRAIRCALAVCDAAPSLGVELRAGLHTGEIELRKDDIGGIAVHVAERVSSHAGSREVVVSRTVVDLVAGSGIGFMDKGPYELKGVVGEWQLFAVQS